MNFGIPIAFVAHKHGPIKAYAKAKFLSMPDATPIFGTNRHIAFFGDFRTAINDATRLGGHQRLDIAFAISVCLTKEGKKIPFKL